MSPPRTKSLRICASAALTYKDNTIRTHITTGLTMVNAAKHRWKTHDDFERVDAYITGLIGNIEQRVDRIVSQPACRPLLGHGRDHAVKAPTYGFGSETARCAGRAAYRADPS